MSVEAGLMAEIRRGVLQYEPAQIDVARRLDRLIAKLAKSRPTRRLFKKTPPPKGLYIHGRVGRGKSMLMDMFFDKVPVPDKSRVHFHAFMQDVHARIHDWRKLDKVARRRHRDYVRGAGDDPVAPVAKGIARDASLLCFDEFHVSDIADAMLLSRLFSALFDRGVVMVATSNRAPQDLYKDGLNRELFVPFIDLLGRRLDIVSLNGERDHRRRAGQTQLYYTPLDQQTQAALETHWQKMCAGQKPEHKTLSVQGRTLDLLCAGGTGRADFATLCQTARGAADYLELTRHVSTLIVENVPVMGPDMAGAAKRFATLIDTLYEAGTRLIISAQAGPDGLYPQGVGSFEFARTASRLLEMCSQAYWNRAREKA